ncbi:unnamed protein product [Zymoseptoria tritici ST99CH_3D7]|uniref:Uncharacterized protein n=1 Tax=Zymoseptoria tritici (strain ST99CH_3D7) TaxID=1276538 RepID=A0A1X7S0K4_ZYMT9|nr:unnamed protein product [Zymoseptoria tritici ST99CH_3D7]
MVRDRGGLSSEVDDLLHKVFSMFSYRDASATWSSGVQSAMPHDLTGYPFGKLCDLWATAYSGSSQPGQARSPPTPVPASLEKETIVRLVKARPGVFAQRNNRQLVQTCLKRSSIDLSMVRATTVKWANADTSARGTARSSPRRTLRTKAAARVARCGLLRYLRHTSEHLRAAKMVKVTLLGLLFSAVALVEAMPKQSPPERSPNEQSVKMFSKRIYQSACHKSYKCDHQSDCAGPEKMDIVPDGCPKCYAKFLCGADGKTIPNTLQGYWCLGSDDDFCF